MKKIIWLLLIVIASVFVFAQDHGRGHPPHGRENFFDTPIEFDSIVTFHDTTFWIDGVGGADKNWAVNDGAQMVFGGDNQFKFLNLVQAYGGLALNANGIASCGAIVFSGDTLRSIGSAAVRPKEVWALRHYTTSPDDADSFSWFDTGAWATIKSENNLLFDVGGGNRFKIAAGMFAGTTDGIQDLGSATERFDEIFTEQAHILNTTAGIDTGLYIKHYGARTTSYGIVFDVDTSDNTAANVTLIDMSGSNAADGGSDYYIYISGSRYWSADGALKSFQFETNSFRNYSGANWEFTNTQNATTIFSYLATKKGDFIFRGGNLGVDNPDLFQIQDSARDIRYSVSNYGEHRFYSDSSTTAYHIIRGSGAEGRHADTTDLRFGLSITDRRAIFCDADDIDTDFGLAKPSNPEIVIAKANGTIGMRLDYGNISTGYSLNITVPTGIKFYMSGDKNIDNAFDFISHANIELTDTDAEQAWVKYEVKVNQTSTAGYTAHDVAITETSTGSGNNNFFRYGNGTDSIYVTNTGDIVTTGEVTASGVTAFNYVDLDIDDTEEYELIVADGKAGWGMASLEDEWTYFRFTAAGVVTLVNETANVSTTDDADNKFNIFDSGTTITFENQLGDDKELNINVWFTP